MFGVLQRDEAGKTRVRAHTIPDTQSRTLLPALRDNVGFSTTVYTDASLGYSRFGREASRIALSTTPCATSKAA